MANRIAEAFIELKVRGQEAVKKATNQVKESVKGLGDGFDSALGTVGERLDQATEGARKLQGAISGIIGIVGIVAAAFYKLGNVLFETFDSFRSAESKVQDFREELRASGKDAAQQADEIRARIKELNDEIARGLNSGRNIAGADGARAAAQQVRGYNKELAELTKLLNEVNFVEQAREQRDADAQARAAREAVELSNQALKAQIEANAVALETEPIKNAELRRAQQIRDLNNEILDAAERLAIAEEDKDANLAARLRERIQLLQFAGQQTKDLIAAEIKGLEELAAERDRLDREANEEARKRALETARIIAEANTQAAAQTRQALLDAVSAINSQGPAFSQLEDLVASIADSVRELKGRI